MYKILYSQLHFNYIIKIDQTQTKILCKLCGNYTELQMYFNLCMDRLAQNTDFE